MTTIFWAIIILYTLIPLITRHLITTRRIKLLQRLQQRRSSRVITMIHRQESVSLLGIRVNRHIDIEDSEQILRAIRLTPADTPIDLIIHTPGGLVLAVEQIARALCAHPAKVTVMVPHYAMSGGTLIALAADEILMDENAVLGPVDPQLGGMPAVSILKVVARKHPDRVDDETMVLADIAEKAIEQVKHLVAEIVEHKLGLTAARELAEALASGRWTHDYPITCEQLRAMKLQTSCGLPREVYELMDLYPQPAGRRPSVQYVPVSELSPFVRRR